MKNTFLLIALVLSQILLTSCGDLFSKKVKSEEIDQFATCELDTQSISLMLEKNIQGDLDCLRANLKFFIEIVKSDRPDYLSQSSLETYINTNLQDVDSFTLEALDAIFKVNTLLFGDDPGYMSRQNVDNLVDFFKEFNRLFVQNRIYEFYASNETMSFSEHNRRKAIIFTTFSQLSETLSRYIVPNNNSIPVAEVINKFKSLSNSDLADDLISVLFMKKALLGGDEKTLSSAQLVRLVSMMGDLGKVSYDFTKLWDVANTESQDVEILKILKEDFFTFYNALYYKDSPDEPIFTYTQLENVVRNFLPEYADYLKYKGTFLKVKQVFLGTDEEVFRSQDLTSIIYDIAYQNIAKGVFFYNAYAFNSHIFATDLPIVNDFNNLRPLISSNTELQFVDQFNRISKSLSKTDDLDSKGYKYFHGSEYLPLFDYSYSRNPRGFFEMAVYEYISQKVFSFYGKTDSNAVGDYIMELEDMERLMLDLSELFVGEGFTFEGKSNQTAETITLISTLFQPSSNGDGKIEINEFVEFIVSMTSSLKLATDMQEELQEKCGADGFEKVHPGCYRLGLKEFLSNSTGREDGKTRKDYLPQMFNYLDNLEGQGLDDYIRATAKFSRTCTHFEDGTEVPMSMGDFIVSWGGFLAIEQSILTFDADRSGILEPREVSTAYAVYKPAIEALIEPAFMKRFSFGIFQYMVKYNRVPEIPDITGVRSFWRALREGTHLIQHLVRPNRFRTANADRMTFATILEIIAKNSPAALEDPFDCEILRDEQTIPVQRSFEEVTIPSLFSLLSPASAELHMSQENSEALPYIGGDQIPTSSDQLPEDIKALLEARGEDVEGIQQQQMQAQMQQQQQNQQQQQMQQQRPGQQQQQQQLQRRR